MKLKDFRSLLATTNKKQVAKFFEDFATCERNKIIDIHRDYYNGDHWIVETNGEIYSTRSGRVIWGKRVSFDPQGNDPLNRRTRQSRNASFTQGQVQTHNYVKDVCQKYVDYLFGDEEGEVSVYIEEGSSAAEYQEVVDSLWSDIESFLKWELGRMYTDTIGAIRINYDSNNNEYYLDVQDPKEFIPIYKGREVVGNILVSTIDAEEAKAYGVNGDSDVTYVEVFLEENDRVLFTRLVDGTQVDQWLALPDQLNFLPIVFVSNIDHPFDDFSETKLEDSEIFNIIERNDVINANETIEFVANLYYASPKLSIDSVAIKELGIPVNSPEFMQALDQYQYFPGGVDNLPLKLLQGEGVPDSFYKGKEQNKKALLEKAGIPEFLFNGTMNNVAAETVELGLKVFAKKISQKRAQLQQLVRDATATVLSTYGVEVEDDDITLIMPDVLSQKFKDLIDSLFQALDRNVLTEQYATERYLELTGRQDDLEEIVNTKQANQVALLESIQKQKSLIESEGRIKSELEKKEAQKKELSNIEEEIANLS